MLESVVCPWDRVRMTRARFSWKGGASRFRQEAKNPTLPGREGWGHGLTHYHVYLMMLPMNQGLDIETLPPVPCQSRASPAIMYERTVPQLRFL